MFTPAGGRSLADQVEMACLLFDQSVRGRLQGNGKGADPWLGLIETSDEKQGELAHRVWLFQLASFRQNHVIRPILAGQVFFGVRRR